MLSQLWNLELINLLISLAINADINSINGSKPVSQYALILCARIHSFECDSYRQTLFVFIHSEGSECSKLYSIENCPLFLNEEIISCFVSITVGNSLI